MLIQTLGILCGLGVATMGTGSASLRCDGHAGYGDYGRYSVIGAFAAAFAAMSLWTRMDGVPSPAIIGTFVVIVVVLQLARPGFFVLTGLCAGVLSAVWVPVLRLQGLGLALALVMAIGVPAVSMVLAIRRPKFAPLPLFEEALLLVLALGLLVAAGPAVASGWESANVMNLQYSVGEFADPANWVFLVGSGAMTLGGCYALWWRSR
jgi:hypothetical protein